MSAAAAADLLYRLAESGETIAALPPALRPRDIEEAYAIQDIALKRYAAYGWKVGPGEVPNVLRAAPLRGRRCFQSPYGLPARDWALMQIEVEVAVTLKRDFAGDVSMEEAAASIGTIHLAYELFRSRFADRTQVDFPSVLADHLNNAGIVLGASTGFDPDQSLETLSIRLTLDDVATAETQVGPSVATLLEQICWLASHAGGRGFPLQAGMVILTGARLGPLALTGCDQASAHSAIGAVSMVKHF